MARRTLLAWLTAILAILAGGGALVLTVAPDDKKSAPATITFKVDGADKDRKADDTVTAGGQAPAVLDAAQAAPERFDLGDNLRGDDPTAEGTVSGPLAAPEWPGCKTRFTPVNFSSRTAPIKAFGLHYTGSRNIPGWADMNGLAAYSASRSAGVSWHFLVDAEGHCFYMVPVSKKAWTIGNLNSQTINAEIIGNGGESSYGGGPGFRKIAAIVRRAASIYGFPVQLGAVRDCQVTRPGIITHWMGGSCAGGHIDIKPYDIAKVAAAMRSAGCDAKCARARDLRARNKATHRELTSRRCAPADRTRSTRCTTLHRRHRAIHAAARRERVKL